jgi:4-amino-4-deoxy-L-arabinose transferase-like glycosyltransferase
MKTKIALCLIFLIALFLRFHKLTEVPPGFHIDEVSIGYNAYSLMETGKDVNGNFLPLYIDSFGDQRPAGYFYLTVPAIKIFGLNEFAVRFPSALCGVLTVILVFFLAKELFLNQTIASISSFLLAISPWHIIVSRASSETSFALFLVILGIYLIIKAIKKQKYFYLFFALLLFSISFCTYHTPRVFVPLLVLELGLCWKQGIKPSKTKKIWLVFLFICFFLSLLSFLIGPGRGRFKQVSIFSNPGVQLRLDEQIREEKTDTNIFLVRLFHNKLVNYGLATLSNYGKHFDFEFLFIKGGLPMRYFVPEMGLLYLAELPFFILGIIFILKTKGISWFVLYWLLVGPIAAALTQEDIPNIQRAFFMLPSFQLITAFGLYRINDFLKKENKIRFIFISLSIILLIYNFSYFLHQYYFHQRVYRPWYRNYGFKQMIESLDKYKADYDQIVITKSHDDPYIYILFYNHYDPRLYQQYRLLRVKDKWGFEQYVFHPSECPSHQEEDILQSGERLFVDKGECKVMPYSRVLDTIYREDQTPVFRLLEVDKEKAIEYFINQENLVSEDRGEK